MYLDYKKDQASWGEAEALGKFSLKSLVLHSLLL